MDQLFLLDQGDDMDLSIDLTPLVDVIFMLIIFFVTATSFVRPAMEVDLARAETATPQGLQRERILIVIDRKGEMYLGQRRAGLAELEPVLSSCDKPVDLQVDRRAPFESFLSVVDLARRLNCDDLVVTTEYAHD